MSKKRSAQFVQSLYAPILVHKALKQIDDWLSSTAHEDNVLGVAAVTRLQRSLLVPLSPEKAKVVGHISPALVQDLSARLGRQISIEEYVEDDEELGILPLEVEDAEFVQIGPVGGDVPPSGNAGHGGESEKSSGAHVPARKHPSYHLGTIEAGDIIKAASLTASKPLHVDVDDVFGPGDGGDLE